MFLQMSEARAELVDYQVSEKRRVEARPIEQQAKEAFQGSVSSIKDKPGVHLAPRILFALRSHVRE